MVAWPWYLILLIVALIPAVGIAGFARWIGRRTELKFEEKAKAWEVFVSMTSALTALVGGVLLIGKYIDEQAAQEANRQEQAKQELKFKNAEALRLQVTALQQKHDHKRKVYDEAKKVAQELVGLGEESVDQLKVGQAKRQQFEQLYWADLIGVEDKHVESAMVRLRKHFEKWVATGKKPAGGNYETDVNQAALKLSEACETDVQNLEDTITKLSEEIVALSSPPKAQ
jgi:glutamate synthase domain-containing protein 1